MLSNGLEAVRAGAVPKPKVERNNIALIAVCLATLMSSLEISSVPVILPTLEAQLHSDFKDIQWIMNAYTIACAAVLMATGTLADRFGRKRLFLISIALFGVASLLCGLAWNTAVLIGSRFLQGVAGGAMLICLVAVLSQQFPHGPERSRAFSVWGVVLGIGLGFGPVVGSVILAVLDWRWVFWVHVVIAVVAMALTFSGVRESRDPQQRRLDVAGIFTLSLAVFGMAFFVTHGSDAGFTSATALTAIAISVLSLVAFLWVELNVADPMFDFSVFRERKFSGALMGSVGMNFSFWAFVIYLPIYFHSALGQSVSAAGVSLLAYTLPTLFFPPIGERIATRWGPQVAIPLGLFTIGVGFMLMFIATQSASADGLSVLPGCLIAGAGLGLTNATVTNTTTGAVPSERAGMASGIDMSARMITLSINIALMGFLLVLGVRWHLTAVLPASLDATQLREMASSIAAGNLNAIQMMPMASKDIARAALKHGFAGVMLYASIAVWLLASISFLIFRAKQTMDVSQRRGL